MARIQNPILFSAHFGVPPQALAAAGLIDPFLNVDVPLFIDPALLEKSSNPTINTAAIARFRQHFEILVRMLAISRAENDAAWKGLLGHDPRRWPGLRQKTRARLRREGF